MTITIRKEITDLMPVIGPIADPTIIDVQDFRKSMGNALFTQKSSATSYRIVEKQYDAYETAGHRDKEIINVLQVKFPTGLTDLEFEEGMLPLTLTGRLSIEHIGRKVISSTVATKEYLHLVKDVTNRAYVPNGS